MGRTIRLSVAMCLLALLAVGGATATGVSNGPNAPGPKAAGDGAFDATDATERECTREDSSEELAPESTTLARIRAVYPNPVAHGDAGEFVTLEADGGRWPSCLTLTDGETTVAVPDGSNATRLTLSTDPNLTRRLRDGQIRAFEGRIRLADAGERVKLRRGDRLLDEFRYENAPEGRVGIVAGGERAWRPLGATDRPVVTGDPGTVEAFVLPDESDVALEFVASADERILLAGYTFSSERVADELVGAQRRGVDVRVLIDGNPVGGMTGREAERLDRLARAGVTVETFDTDRSRYAFHHAKYAVVDDEALVTSENWKPAGLGGRQSRGWGVVTDQPAVVTGLSETFAADAGWQDTVDWNTYDRRVVEGDPPANGSYPRTFEATRVPVERTRLAVAPDNAHGELRELIEGAEESIRIQQVRIGDPDYELLAAAVDAARRGVEVRILLDDSWYVEDDNAALAERVNTVAEREGLALEARLAESGDAYGKIHAKGVVVDGRHAVVGSLNWNEHASNENREVVLILSGAEVGDYYATVFDADWGSEEWGFPWGVLVAVGAVVLLAGGVAVALRFEPARDR